MRYGALGRRYGRMQKVVASSVVATDRGRGPVHEHVCQLACGHSAVRAWRAGQRQHSSRPGSAEVVKRLRCPTCG